MSDVTQLLHALDAGDPKAADQLLPLVYQELRKLAEVRMAQDKPGQTLQATALVHEAWLRLAGADQQKAWNSRGHFFAAAAEAMRRILASRRVPQAGKIRRSTPRRSGQKRQLTLHALQDAPAPDEGPFPVKTPAEGSGPTFVTTSSRCAPWVHAPDPG